MLHIPPEGQARWNEGLSVAIGQLTLDVANARKHIHTAEHVETIKHAVRTYDANISNINDVVRDIIRPDVCDINLRMLAMIAEVRHCIERGFHLDESTSYALAATNAAVTELNLDEARKRAVAYDISIIESMQKAARGQHTAAAPAQSEPTVALWDVKVTGFPEVPDDEPDLETELHDARELLELIKSLKAVSPEGTLGIDGAAAYIVVEWLEAVISILNDDVHDQTNTLDTVFDYEMEYRERIVYAIEAMRQHVRYLPEATRRDICNHVANQLERFVKYQNGEC